MTEFQYLHINMDQLRILKGNTFYTRNKITAYRYDGSEIEGFSLQTCDEIKIIANKLNAREIITNYNIVDNNNIRIQWPGPKQTLGPYRLEIMGKYNGVDWRYFDRDPMFVIVDHAREVNIPKDSVISEDYFVLDSSSIYIDNPNIIIAAQSDWNETNTSSFSYIRNKPDLLDADVLNETLILD